MGEIADDMIDGACCELCGQYFQNPKASNLGFEHGYPAVCHECWTQLDTKDKRDHNRALVKTFGG